MLALYLLTSTKTDLSALQLMRPLDFNYKAAWRIKHKAMQAMVEREAPRRLEGSSSLTMPTSAVSATVAGRAAVRPASKAFLAVVETDADLEHPRCAVLEPVRTFDNIALKDWCQR